ncbi:uncharacterized protein PG998_001175 [Apiospora kogelbergensis]|uniref:uncharacterized protein n=1 Tax=Apiospora kogelbergensis TaxID=1337665 RepID=UPI00312D6530
MPSNKEASKISTDGVALSIALAGAVATAISAAAVVVAWCLMLGARRWQDPSNAALSPHNLNQMDLRELRGRMLG